MIGQKQQGWGMDRALFFIEVVRFVPTWSTSSLPP